MAFGDSPPPSEFPMTIHGVDVYIFFSHANYLFSSDVYISFLPSASSDNMARLWNVDQGEVVREYSGHQKAVVALAFRDAHAMS